MQTILQHHEIAAAFIARVFLGLLFFFQGYDAVFKIKVGNIIKTYQTSFEEKGIPKIITTLGSYFTSYVELIGGLFLVLGFFKYSILYLLGIDLILASIAFGIHTPLWDTRFVFPRLILLLFLLAIPTYWDNYSLDILVFKS